ncbi:MAG TPA: hypothetical protein VFP95_05345, partial [Gammaproteobacteria bacterium]|nr:hypothetical protein [Gammaproteobacteria bacterium]
MPRTSPQRLHEIRTRLTQEAARIMAEEGGRDYRIAKRKAADRLGIRDAARVSPTNREIEQAVVDHHRLFRAESQPQRLQQLRQAAKQAMQLFADFEPRLTGSVLAGTATLHSSVQLHLFSDVAEQVSLHLMTCEIPHELSEKRLRLLNGDYRHYPCYGFLAGDVPIEAIVFPFDALRQPPASPVDGKPMKRASYAEVESLLSKGRND